MSHRFILVEGVPTPEPDPDKWNDWRHTHNSMIIKEEVSRTIVATYFLGEDLDTNDPPQLWAVIVSRQFGNTVIKKFATVSEALSAHRKAVDEIKVR